MNVQKSALAKRGHWDANTEQLGLMGMAKNQKNQDVKNRSTYN